MRNRAPFKAPGRNDVFFSVAAVAGLLVLGFCGSARGQEVSANVAIGSDYVFRGVSQSEEDAAVSAGVDLTGDVFYAGAWASNVSFAGDGETSVEGDLYLGVRSEFAGWNWDFGAIAYLYDDPSGLGYDYVEAKVAASRALDPATIGAAVYWSPDFFGAAEEEATYLEANAAWSVSDRWGVSGALGRQFLSSDLDYTTWNLGAAWQLTDRLSLDLRYHDTDAHDFGEVYEARAVASLKAIF